MASKPGPRPHLWRVQGEIPHEQFKAWHMARAQAHHRGETWLLTFEEYQQAWSSQWHLRGRTKHSVCMVRCDPELAWESTNIEIIPRIEHFRRSYK